MTVAVALLVIFFIGSAVCAIAAEGIPAFAGTIRQKEVLFALRLSAATASLSTLIVMALALPTAYTLGASPWRCFLTILLPLCRRSLVSTFILTWSRALGEFGATLMLVGITRFKTETLPGSIYLSISTGDNQAAMATAMLMLIISGLTLFLSRLLASPADRNKRQVFIR